jgi:hypothetical protein
MEIAYFGSFRFLKQTPGWIILFFGPLCTTGVIWLLRIIFEGRLYDYSRASFPGDIFLFIYLLCIGQLLKKHAFLPIPFFFKKTWHWITFLGACVITVGLYSLALDQGEARARATLLPANMYHFFVQLALSYAVSSGLPVIIFAKERRIQYLAIACLITYLCLLIFDVFMGNLSQHVQ